MFKDCITYELFCGLSEMTTTCRVDVAVANIALFSGQKIFVA